MSANRLEYSKAEIEASEWIAVMSDRTVSLEQRAQFQAWLRKDQEHGRVYRVQRAAFQAIGGMAHLLEEERKAPAGLDTPRRVFGRYAALAAALVLAIGAS